MRHQRNCPRMFEVSAPCTCGGARRTGGCSNWAVRGSALLAVALLVRRWRR